MLIQKKNVKYSKSSVKQIFEKKKEEKKKTKEKAIKAS
jgi:hypothetical protein